MTNGEIRANRGRQAPALARTVVLLMLICLQPAYALSIREMRALEQSDKKHGPNYVRYYLVGAMEGALEANSQSLRSGAKALFCLNGRRLEPRMAKPLFDAELRRNAAVYEADMPVQLVLFNALVTSYTC